MRKGIELPVNVLVIVAIAIIVLLGLVALFMGGFGGFAGNVETTNAWSSACGEVLSSCGSDHFSDPITPVGVGGVEQTTFGGLCVALGRNTGATPASGNTATNGCNQRCGCPA